MRRVGKCLPTTSGPATYLAHAGTPLHSSLPRIAHPAAPPPPPYPVFRVLPIDASGKGQAPVLIATGRVPVFDAAANATTGAVSACSWAPGGPMTPSDQVGCGTT